MIKICFKKSVGSFLTMTVISLSAFLWGIWQDNKSYAAADSAQYLMDQEKDEEFLLKTLPDGEGDDGFLEESSHLPEMQVDAVKDLRPHKNSFDQHLHPEKNAEISTVITDDEKVKNSDGFIAGQYENEENYLEGKVGGELRTAKKSSRSHFAFFIGKDDFRYRTSTGQFDRIFRDSARSKTPLFLRLSGHSFTRQSLLGRLGYGVNMGVGYNAGKAQFVDGAASDTNIILWTLPIDFSVIYELRIARVLKLGGAAGPSALGLWQNRSDLDYDDKRKTRRQYSLGYFAEAFVRMDVTGFFSSNPLALIRKYSISSILLTASLRNQKYSQFKDSDLTVSGQSLAVGLTYEFL